MKTKFIIAAFALAFSGASFGSCVDSPGANGCGGNISGPSTTNLPGANPTFNDNTANAVQGQQQGQLQGQQQGQGQSQTAVGGTGVGGNQSQGQIGINKNANVNVNANESESNSASVAAANAAASNKGNTQSTTINTYNPGQIDYSGGYTVKSAPGIALGGPASGPCNGFSGGLAISGLGFGGALNASTVDQSCVERETARMLGLLGKPEMGLELIQSSDVWQKHLKRKQEAQKRAEDESRMATVVAAQRVEQTKAVATATKGTTVTPAVIGGADITDPFIRARMGLPK